MGKPELASHFPSAAAKLDGAKLYGKPLLDWSKEDLAIFAIVMSEEADKSRSESYKSDREWMRWAIRNAKKPQLHFTGKSQNAEENS